MPAALIPAVLGAAQTAAGLLKSGIAKNEAEQLAASRPKLGNSPYLKDNLSLAKSELASGMSGEAENAFEQGISRDLSTSLDTILKSGGDVNNVAEIFDRSQTGRQRLALMKENLQLAQINNLANAYNASENERLQQFQVNDLAPWMDKAQSVAATRQGAENMIWSGLQTAGSAIAGMMQNQEAQNDYNSYFRTEQRVTPSRALRSTPVRGVSYNTSVMSPGAGRGYIEPNYIDESLF